MRTTPKTRPGVIGRGPRPTRPKWSSASAANRTAAIGNNQITVASYTPFDSGTGVAGAHDARPGRPCRAGRQRRFPRWAVEGGLLSLPDPERGKPGRKGAGDLWGLHRWNPRERHYSRWMPKFRYFCASLTQDVIFSGVIGISAIVTPKGARASSTARVIAGGETILPPSPPPLTPNSVKGDGVS